MDAQPEVGQVGAADRDRAGGAQALDLRRVDRGDGLGQRGDAGGRRRCPATSMFSLTVNGTPCSGPRRSVDGVGRVGRRARLVGEHDDDRVQVRR